MTRNISWIGYATWLLLTFAGCAGRHVPPQAVSCHGRVILFRGLWDVFSLGLDDLAEKAADDGFDVFVARGPEWRDVANREAAARLRCSQPPPLIVGGHSYGADNAVRFCEALGYQGLDVDLLLLLDATNPPLIPANVHRCVQLFRSSFMGTLFPGVFAGNPVEAAEGNDRTRIENFLITPESLGREAFTVGHFNIDANPAIHDLCLREMNRVYRKERVDSGVGSHDAPRGDSE